MKLLGLRPSEATSSRSFGLGVIAEFVAGFMILGVSSLFAQEETRKEDDASVSAQIPVISDFVPPVEKPRVAPRSFRPVKNLEVRSAGRSIRSQVVKDPKIPRPPSPPSPRDVTPISDEALAKLLARFQQTVYVGIGATVYNGERSKVQWSYNGERYEAWSNVDFRLFQGIGEVKRNGRTFSYMLMASGLDYHPLDRAKPLPVPEHPELPELDVAYVVTTGDDENEEALEVITALHELYADRKDELEAAYVKRVKYAEDASAWRKANPPQPRDIKVSFWRR
jgi:hypothetical protein